MSNDRFDKFTARARQVLTLAQEEATRFNHNYIGTEHLLLGLVREGEGVAAKVLANLGVELNRVRSAVEFIIGRGDRMIVGEIGLTPRAKTVIELAVDEARRLGHHYIGTEHLLLGLVREGSGIAAGVLESLGVNLEKVRVQTIQVLSQLGSAAATIEDATGPPADASARSMPGSLHSGDADRFDKFTERARKVLSLAQEEATRLNHNYMGTEHLLLGLIREGEGVAAGVLESLGVNLEKARTQTIQILSQASGGGQGHGPAGAAGAQLHPDRPEQTWPAEAVRQWAGGDPSGQQRPAPASPARWQYCIVQVTYPDASGSGIVGKIYGGGDEGRFGHNTTPVYQALQTLGAEGWELVAVDTAMHASGAANAHYILKRPLQA